MTEFQPTHEIVVPGDVIPVHLDEDGAAYTQIEWETADACDWTFDERGLLFQGQPHTAMIRRIQRG